MKKWAQSGFTIVELLIVVVVIAILAAITIVSYNGIQQRANNTAIIDAASKAKRMVQAYVSSTGQYPSTAENVFICITTDTSCRRNSGPMAGDSTFESAIATVGKLPRSAPLVSDVRGGVTYNYSAFRAVDGTPAPVIISYYLFGINADCGMTVLATEAAGAIVTSPFKYSGGNVGGSGATQCVVSVPGPAV